MPKREFKELLDAGVHFGHLKRKWNPHMAPYIFMEQNGIHIIDLHKTAVKLEEAANAMKQIVNISQLDAHNSNATNMCIPPDTTVQGTNLRVHK